MSSSASAISRLLRENGLRPIPSGSNREGLRVTGRDSIFIRLDFDSDTLAERTRADVEEILVEAGFTVRAVSDRVLSISR